MGWKLQDLHLSTIILEYKVKTEHIITFSIIKNDLPISIQI